jgi:isoquinoline 1-oxidoreductase alpha subunit
MKVSFKVNGQPRTVDVPGDMPLLWTLRDTLELKGTKFGTHALQRAWEELDVPQCGYCQAGQLMAAASLLSKKPHPTDAEIDDAMNGNLCRCATYLRIRQAIHRAADLKAQAIQAGEPKKLTGSRP